MAIELHDFLEHPVLLAILIAANWPVYRWLVQIMFGGGDGLGEAIKFWFIPDIYSFFSNRYFEDQWAELRLAVWAALCVGTVAAEYLLVKAFLDWWYAHVVCCGPAG